MPANKPIVKEAIAEKSLILLRISEIMDRLMREDEVFEELNKDKMMESLSALVEKAPQELVSIDNDELSRRIEKIMLIEAMSGMLDDLSLSEMEAFEAATKRREFF